MENSLLHLLSSPSTLNIRKKLREFSKDRASVKAGKVNSHLKTKFIGHDDLLEVAIEMKNFDLDLIDRTFWHEGNNFVYVKIMYEDEYIGSYIALPFCEKLNDLKGFITGMRKYLLNGLLNIASQGEEDDDGASISRNYEQRAAEQSGELVDEATFQRMYDEINTAKSPHSLKRWLESRENINMTLDDPDTLPQSVALKVIEIVEKARRKSPEKYN